MPTVQAILNNADKYRNSYSAADKVDWMDAVQREIFQDVPHEAVPYTFDTVDGFAFYPLPADCDPLGVKQVVIETKAGSEKYTTLRYVSVESEERFSSSDEFYSVQANQNLFLNPLPTSDTEGRKVYLYYNKRPETLSSTNLSAIPDLEEDFHELLVLGTKAKIAEARGEFDDKAEFDLSFSRLYQQYVKRYKFNFPEYSSVKDVMTPMRRGGRVVGGRRRGVWGLIPYD